MKTVLIVSLLVLQSSASFFDEFAPVESSFGKLVTDVVSDIKDTIDCTILAVEHVFSLEGLFRDSSNYDERCRGQKQERTVIAADQPEMEPYAYQTYDTTNNDVQEPTAVEELSQQIDESVSDASEQIKTILDQSHAQQKIENVKNTLKNESDRMSQISALMKKEIDKFPEDMRTKLEFNQENPTIDNILDEIKLLYQFEQKDKSSAQANEIRHLFDEVLKILHVNDTGGNFSDEGEVKEIIRDLGKASNDSLVDVEKQVSQWTEEQNKDLKDIKNIVINKTNAKVATDNANGKNSSDSIKVNKIICQKLDEIEKEQEKMIDFSHNLKDLAMGILKKANISGAPSNDTRQKIVVTTTQSSRPNEQDDISTEESSESNISTTDLTQLRDVNENGDDFTRSTISQSNNVSDFTTEPSYTINQTNYSITKTSTSKIQGPKSNSVNNALSTPVPHIKEDTSTEQMPQPTLTVQGDESSESNEFTITTGNPIVASSQMEVEENVSAETNTESTNASNSLSSPSTTQPTQSKRQESPLTTQTNLTTGQESPASMLLTQKTRQTKSVLSQSTQINKQTSSESLLLVRLHNQAISASTQLPETKVQASPVSTPLPQTNGPTGSVVTRPIQNNMPVNPLPVQPIQTNEKANPTPTQPIPTSGQTNPISVQPLQPITQISTATSQSPQPNSKLLQTRPQLYSAEEPSVQPYIGTFISETQPPQIGNSQNIPITTASSPVLQTTSADQPVSENPPKTFKDVAKKIFDEKKTVMTTPIPIESQDYATADDFPSGDIGDLDPSIISQLFGPPDVNEEKEAVADAKSLIAQSKLTNSVMSSLFNNANQDSEPSLFDNPDYLNFGGF